MAASFRSMPRAPSCSASTSCSFSMAAVRTMVRTWPRVDANSRSTSIPVSRGIARSNIRTSGFSKLVNLATSDPSAASPTTENFGSDSSNVRSPYRKTGWSSATKMRIFSDFSAMEPIRNGNFQPCSMLWRRVNRQFAADQAHTFFDHTGTAMCCIELRLGCHTTKPKSQAVVRNQEFALSFLACAKPHYHISRSAMFPYVREPLLNYTHNFVTYARRQRDAVLLRLETDRDTGFTPESCDQFRQKIRQFLGAEVQGLGFLD